MNLRKLYEARGRELPTSHAVLFDNYEIWLLAHSVSVVQEGGYRRVEQLGYRVHFPETPKVTVLDMLPQSQTS